MDRQENINKKSGGKVRIVVLILTIIALFTSFFTIFEIFQLSTIENLIRYIVIGVIILIDIILFIKTKIVFKKRKKSKRIGYITFLIFYTLICGAIGGVIFYVYGVLLSGFNKVYVTYSSSLVTMSSDKADKINDIKDYKIGLLNDKESPEGYVIPQEIIKENDLNDENEIKKYDNYSSMLADLYSDDIDAAFLPSEYESMFSNITDYENIKNDTKVIIKKEKKMKKSETSKQENASSGKSITEPFTILLMGIDSTDEVLSKNAVANGDTLILITFNPKTLSATMISIPRDSYVPIACWSNKAENKITHAAGYGTDCMLNTIENYFDVNIDYYAKINFKGLVKLVDAIGGVDVDVEKKLCTDDSNRINIVCINPGLQTLNGEQALVYARNRKSLANGDFGRAQHQQIIVKALVNKIKDIRDVSKFIEILNTISNSMDTNFTRKQILSFYNIAKDISKKSLAADNADLVDIQQLYLQGDGQMIYDENMRMVLWNYVPNKDSKKAVIKAMKENLELAEHDQVKEFSFSINEPYEKEIIGQGPYKSNYTYDLVPNFIGYGESVARSMAARHGLKVNFTGGMGTVISQSYPANKRVDKTNGTITLKLSGSVKSDDDDDKKSKTTTSSTTTKSTKTNDEKDDEDSTASGSGSKKSGTSTDDASGSGEGIDGVSEQGEDGEKSQTQGSTNPKIIEEKEKTE